jgi:hypothetical protein
MIDRENFRDLLHCRIAAKRWRGQQYTRTSRTPEARISPKGIFCGVVGGLAALRGSYCFKSLLCTNAGPKPIAPSVIFGVQRELLRMRDWPSIAPGAPEDYYIVINRYGEYGPAFAETDLGRADLETTISDVMSGQHCDPLRVVVFNTDADRAEDVSHAIAQEILRNVPPELERFIEHHVGRDRQLILRLA